MARSNFKPGDRVVYVAIGRPPNTGGTVIRVDPFPNPAGTWPRTTYYLFVILDTAEEVSDVQSSFWHEQRYNPEIPF